ncbi:MAG: thiamine-phosphate pyrophosphorylase [Gaiellaceae bacterium]|nr:thiamine-phosphate pyrophosphorylase [Gaiellaceae bacterium]
MKLHAVVSDLETARLAAENGATVVQLRLKNTPTFEVVERGRAFRGLTERLGLMFVVNDDVQAAIRLDADAVHLGTDDEGLEEARDAGLQVGLSASSRAEAEAAAGQGPAYVGAGPVWATPSKHDAAAPIGLEGLASICGAVSVPVVAIGGIDATNAADCIRAGAAGVAVVRAAPDARALVEAIDAAL